nr:substrate-binding domain-containing protein [Spirochaetales bacterium]
RKEKRKESKPSIIAILQPIDKFSMHSWNIFTRIINETEQHLVAQGYFPIISPVNNILPSEETCNKLLEMHVKAVISIHHIEDSLFSALKRQGIPVVIVNNSSLENSYTSVLVDDFQGAYNAAQELVSKGHKQILYMDYPRTDLPNILVDRRMGVQKAGLEYEKKGCRFHIVQVPYYDAKSIKKALGIIEKEHITAILLHDDYLAASVYMVLKELNYQIPEDISMISTGGGVLDYTLASTPQISAYQLDVDLMGKIVGEETLRLIKLDKPEESVRALRTKQLYADRHSIACLK